MHRRDIMLGLAAAPAIAACGMPGQPPVTQGDLNSASFAGYQPLDPLEVKVRNAPTSASQRRSRILDALPDETMRMAVGEYKAGVGLSYGPAKLSVAGGQYIVTIDYGKSATFGKAVRVNAAAPAEPQAQPQAQPQTRRRVEVAQSSGSGRTPVVANAVIPVYVGVGLRLTARLTTLKSGINLGNLIVIGAEAEANALSGTLVVQTLGVSGETISTALPMPNELSQASIQNAIQALGTMKAKLYDNNTRIEPRVVGLYNPNDSGTTDLTDVVEELLRVPLELTLPA
jgi:hypothetical protein